MWALKTRGAGSMMNPFEYRDLMNAAYGWTDESPAEVTARYKSKAAKKGKKGKPGEPQFKVSSAEQQKFQALLALAKPRTKSPGE